MGTGKMPECVQKPYAENGLNCKLNCMLRNSTIESIS